MGSDAKNELRLRSVGLKDCTDLRLFSRTLDVGELFLDVPSDEKESLTKFSKFEHEDRMLFVEQHVLSQDCWRQVSRWIKYEEALEENESRWGKPHIPALNFHSLVNLRRIMEAGPILLDLEATDMASIVSEIVNNLEVLESSDLKIVRKTLLLKHSHVDDSEKVWNFLEREMNQIDVGGAETGGAGNISLLSLEDIRGIRQLSHLVRRIPEEAEAAVILCSEQETLKGLAVAFVRLAEGILMPGLTEVPIPVRFVFVLLGPATCEITYSEVGRCMGVLLTNSIFRHIIYQARERREILVALNEFLDASMIIPHGEWDYEMFHIQKLQARAHSIYVRKLRGSLESSEEGEPEPIKFIGGPFERTKRPFGGVWNDIRRRYAFYWSDIRDGLNVQCLAVAIFMYFACVASACALGATLARKTENFVGISENLLGSSVGGVIFALLGCQPLLVLATSGSLLVFEMSLYDFCVNMDMKNEFLAMRFWTGIWMSVVGLVVTAAEGSVLAKYLSRFTQEIFAVFISVVFIWESFKLVTEEFMALVVHKTKTLADSGVFFTNLGLMMTTFSLAMTFRAFKNSTYGTKLIRKHLGNFGVFLSIVVMSILAYFLTPFDPVHKNLILPDAITYGLRTTRSDNVSALARPTGWIVDPMRLSVTWIVAASAPGLLLFVVVFIELSIAELLMDRKESLMRKGGGFHADVLLICLINSLMGLLGTNFLSPATLRGVTHLMALAVYSTNNPPGVPPEIIETKEQRLTALFTSIILGFSVVMGRALQYVPTSVLLGFFLYMGITSLKGMQFADRTYLMFKQVSNYPEVPYVKQVRTWKMHVFTLIELLALAIIWAIKTSPAALVLPICFVTLPIIRKFLLVRFYSPVELEALDGSSSGQVVKREPLKVDLTPLSPQQTPSNSTAATEAPTAVEKTDSKLK